LRSDVVLASSVLALNVSSASGRGTGWAIVGGSVAGQTNAESETDKKGGIFGRSGGWKGKHYIYKRNIECTDRIDCYLGSRLLSYQVFTAGSRYGPWI
jgi:hypothetical protein